MAFDDLGALHGAGRAGQLPQLAQIARAIGQRITGDEERLRLSEVLIQVSLINVLEGVPARITQRLYAVYSSPAAAKLTQQKRSTLMFRLLFNRCAALIFAG